MATLFVRHTVEDYAKWKRVYDDFVPTRKKMGVMSASVHRDPVSLSLNGADSGDILSAYSVKI